MYSIDWRTGGTKTVNLLSPGDAAGVPHADGVDVEQLGQAEVGDLGVHIHVQQDVTRLEIAVDDPQPRVLVEVEEPAADPLDDLVPLSPAQLLLPFRICEIQFNSSDDLISSEMTAGSCMVMVMNCEVYQKGFCRGCCC